jgi:two-component system sensor histidine kinase RpfC
LTSRFDISIETALAAQARVRLALVVVCVAIVYGVLSYNGVGDKLSLPLAALHFAYAAAALALTHKWPLLEARTLAYATTVLDPLATTGWVINLDEYGSLLVGIYLFTIVGFALRTGDVRLVRVAHLTSLAGFALCLAVEPFWQQHELLWFSLLVMLVLPPLYVIKLMERLHGAIAFAKSESAAKSDMLARVSHELRTPLTGIIAAAELLEAGRHRATILTLGDQLLTEINDLLDEAKFAANSLTLTPAPYRIESLAALLEATVGNLARTKGLAFEVRVDPAIAGPLLCDGHHLGRVLINLAGNGVKFTERGGVTVDISLADDTGTSCALRFSVEDTGIGIPQEMLGRIFDPFYQIKRKAHAPAGGTGLGLTIAQHLVSLMSPGGLRVSSRVGAGSRFWFDATFEKAARDAVVEPVSAEAAMVGKRILVVDDHETNLVLVRELLMSRGHEVATAADGTAALDILGRERFDVVLLDYNLPDMDGATVLRAYRAGCLDPAPVCFLTADASSFTADRLKTTGAVAVLNKPARIDELQRLIAQVCGRTAPRAAAPEAAAAALEAEPLIDPQAIDRLHLIGTRPGFMREFRYRAALDIRENCARIREGLADSSYGTVRDAAHALKGVCASAGAARLMNAGMRLMSADDRTLSSRSLELIAQIDELEAATIEALSQFDEDQAPAAVAA